MATLESLCYAAECLIEAITEHYSQSYIKASIDHLEGDIYAAREDSLSLEARMDRFLDEHLPIFEAQQAFELLQAAAHTISEKGYAEDAFDDILNFVEEVVCNDN